MSTPLAPHLADRDEQTGIVGRLQQVLEAPRAFAGWLAPRPRRDQAEAHAEGVVGVSF